MEDAYARSVSEVLDFFGVDPAKGLSDSQVDHHSRMFGRNVLPEEKRTPFWKLVLKQFDDLLVKILIVAAIVSFVLALANGETGLTAFLEPFVILLILAANAAVGVITETNAEKALEELRAYQANIATVLRNGCFSILPASELVPGDIVEVTVGCKIPADLRIIEMSSNEFRVDQAILTGESCSVEKDVECTSTTNAVYQDKKNILFSGTDVVAGRGRAVVIGVGSNTAMGSIHDSMLHTDDEATPLKKKLDEFGSFLAKVIAGICVLVWVVNIGHFSDPSHGGFFKGAIHYFKIAVALAVAAIPDLGSFLCLSPPGSRRPNDVRRRRNIPLHLRRLHLRPRLRHRAASLPQKLRLRASRRRQEESEPAAEAVPPPRKLGEHLVPDPEVVERGQHHGYELPGGFFVVFFESAVAFFVFFSRDAGRFAGGDGCGGGSEETSSAGMDDRRR